MIFLGIDIGTTNIKICAIDSTGCIIDSSYSKNATTYPYPGWAEQDPDLWWRNVLVALQEMRNHSVFNFLDVRAIGVSGQGAAIVPIEKSGKALSKAMIYLDRRAKQEAVHIKELMEDVLRKKPLNSIQSWNPLAKILWTKHNRDEIYKNTYKFVGASGYITYKLTGAAVANKADAGTSCLYDYFNDEWDEGLLDLLGIDRNKMPAIAKCEEVLGKPTEAVAKEIGINPHLKVIAGGEDTSAEAFSIGMRNSTQAYCFMGTSSNLGICIDKTCLNEYPKNPVKDAIIFPHLEDSKYLVNTTMLSTGSTYEWFMNILFSGNEKRKKKDREALDGISYLILHPYLKGKFSEKEEEGAAFGSILGLTINTNIGQIEKMIYEGCSYELLENIDHYEGSGFQISTIRLAGGSTANKAWCQTIADVTGRPISISASCDSAFGMALFSLVLLESSNKNALNLNDNQDEVLEVYPRQSNTNEYKKLFKIYRELQDKTQDLSKELKILQNSILLP